MKEKLIAVTIDLIKETHGSVEKITMRRIAERAGVGVGLINYHFKSKTNLIELCVQRIIGDVIAQSKPDMANLTPTERFKRSVKIPLDFLADNPEIARISILNDLTCGQKGDNTFKTLERYCFYAGQCDGDEDTFFRTVLLLHGMQGIFLRRDLYKDNFDFSDKAQRDRLVDRLADRLFGGEHE